MWHNENEPWNKNNELSVSVRENSISYTLQLNILLCLRVYVYVCVLQYIFPSFGIALQSVKPSFKENVHKNCVPLRGRHQSSIYPDKGEEWQERTEFVILFLFLVKKFRFFCISCFYLQSHTSKHIEKVHNRKNQKDQLLFVVQRNYCC